MTDITHLQEKDAIINSITELFIADHLFDGLKNRKDFELIEARPI